MKCKLEINKTTNINKTIEKDEMENEMEGCEGNVDLVRCVQVELDHNNDKDFFFLDDNYVFRIKCKEEDEDECAGFADNNTDNCIGFSRIKCSGCGALTCFGAQQVNYNDDEDDENAKKFIIYYCDPCSRMYVACYNCITHEKCQLMTLVEHHNFNYKKFPLTSEINSGQIQQVVDERKWRLYGYYENETDEYNNDNIQFNFTTLLHVIPGYVYDAHKFGPITGPDGGGFSKWKCNICDTEVTYCDK